MRGIIRYFKSLMTKQYGIYHTRWQISAIVMMGPMLILEMFGFPLWLNLMIGQFIGACIFYSIDQWIFRQHKKDTLENEMSKKVN